MYFLHDFYYTRLSNPAEDRTVYQHLLQVRPHRIMEIGIQLGHRTRRLLTLAQQHCPNGKQLRYYCNDPFEHRRAEDGIGLTLRKTYHLLNALDVKFRALPGNPTEAMSQFHTLSCHADFLVIAMPNDTWIPATVPFLQGILTDEATLLVGQRTNSDTPYRFEKYTKQEWLDQWMAAAGGTSMSTSAISSATSVSTSPIPRRAA